MGHYEAYEHAVAWAAHAVDLIGKDNFGLY